MLNLSPGDRFWAGDWGGGSGRNARSRGPSGGWVGELPEMSVGEGKCLAGRWMGEGGVGSGVCSEIAKGRFPELWDGRGV